MKKFNNPNNDRVTCPICADKCYMYMKHQYICPSCIDSLNNHINITNSADILGHQMELLHFMKVLNDYKKFNYHDRNLAVDFYHICKDVYRDDDSTSTRLKELETQCVNVTSKSSMYQKLWHNEVNKPLYRKVIDSIPFIFLFPLKAPKIKNKKGKK